MRFYSALALSLALASAPALAAPTPDNNAKPAASRHVVHKARIKTAGTPAPTVLPDPNAGTDEQGTPNPAVTNGGELAR